MTASDSSVAGVAAKSDRIELRDLRVMCVIGLLDHERIAPQPLSIDVDLYADLSQAGATDDLTRTVDYGAVCDRIVALCAQAQPQLLERLAEMIAAELCAIDAVTVATVAVAKLRPPVAADLGTSAVRITRRSGQEAEPNGEAVARAARERSEQEREATGDATSRCASPRSR